MKKQKINVGTQTRSALTKRECEILKFLGQGLTRNEMAAKLFVSPETIKKHLQNAYKKLRAKNKVEALRKMKWL